MSATVDRPAAHAASASAPPRALARAEGLELLGEVSGSGYKDGIRLARRADGQVVQLGPLMYGLLEEVDGRRDVAALAEATSRRVGRRLARDHAALPVPVPAVGARPGADRLPRRVLVRADPQGRGRGDRPGVRQAGAAA